MPFSLFLALKYMRPKRSFVSVVTVISVVGVLLGVSILVIVLSVMTGFDEMWREKILSFKPHLTVVSTYGSIDDPEDLCRKIESIDGVTGVAPVIITRALMRSEGRMTAPVVVGIDDVRAGSVSKVRVLSDDPASISERPQYLAGIEAEGCAYSELTRSTSPVLRSVRLSRILNYHDSVSVGDLQNWVHVRDLAVEMDGQDNFGSLGDRCFQEGRIHVERCVVGVDVHLPFPAHFRARSTARKWAPEPVPAAL